MEKTKDMISTALGEKYLDEDDFFEQKINDFRLFR